VDKNFNSLDCCALSLAYAAPPPGCACARTVSFVTELAEVDGDGLGGVAVVVVVGIDDEDAAAAAAASFLL
jgi:hypothetical protein